MKLQENSLRVAGTLAICAGYGFALTARAWRAGRSRLLPRLYWRKLQVGPVRLCVPPDWGELETTPDGGFIICNRPRRFRVDGDAVWYSMAIELGIWRTDMARLPRLAPMTETRRTIETEDGPVIVTLAVANGVGRSKQVEAQRVLASVRAVRAGPRLHWPGG